MEKRVIISKITAAMLWTLGIILMLMSVSTDDELPLGKWLAYTFGLFICSLAAFGGACYINRKGNEQEMQEVENR